MKNETTFLDTQQLAQRWHISAGTLRNWRSAGKGPQFHRIGNRIRYGLADVQAWEVFNLDMQAWRSVKRPTSSARSGAERARKIKRVRA